MTAEPYYVDPNTKKLVDGDRNRPGQANVPPTPGSGSTKPSTAPTPTKPGDDSGCGVPKVSNAGTPANAQKPQPGSPGPQPTPNNPDKRPANQGNPPQPLPQPQRPGRPKGQTTGQHAVSTNPKSNTLRPGEGVQTDRNGKTYEGKTGVSGETAEGSGAV